MTDKQYKDQKKRIQKYIDKWFADMGLGWFKIDFVWERERDATTPATIAKTTSAWQYRHGTIQWFLPACQQISDEELESSVIHEFVHVLINPLCVVSESGDLDLQHEYATETITRAFEWVRLAGQKDKS